MRDMMNKLDMLVAFAPKAAVTDNTAQVSAILDRQGFHGVTLAIALGTNTDADATFTALLEESADGVNFDAVDNKDMVGTEVLASFDYSHDVKCRKLGYIGIKRYLRATITPANNGAGNIFLSGIWLLGYGERDVQANPPAILPYT